jgi:NAD(P)-dependent dehydrogenase (short-subunit alcohol dehydrogenase family)
MTERDLEGRTALVTGGAKGIGRACCRRIAEAGAKVAVNYLTSEAAAVETARMIEQAGSAALAIRADVSAADEVRAMVEEVTESLGPIDLLVNNAGVFDYVTHEETTLDLWQRTLDRNLTSAYLVTWAVKEGMIERGFGRIVNITSIAGLRARPNSIAYAVSKAGMIALTKSLAEAVARHNVRVNAVAPGLIETTILDGVAPEDLDTIIRASPIPRIGQPEEIAEAVLFLLSERSSFTTGQTLVASGGRVLLP